MAIRQRREDVAALTPGRHRPVVDEGGAPGGDRDARKRGPRRIGYRAREPSAQFLCASLAGPTGQRQECRRREGAQTAAHSGSANTNRLLPELGRSSGVSPDSRAADRFPVLAATYWRPSTA